MFLGIDAGTQSVKALLYDAEAGEVAAVATEALELVARADGTREQSAQWWLDALAACLGKLEPGLRARVQAIGVSGQQHGFVPLAADGTVLAPVKLWCDTTTVAECEEISSAFGGMRRCIDEVGNAILPGYTAPKIRWLKNHRPELYAQLHTILLPHDYINFYLTGERAMECGDASGTGLLDIRKREWHPGMLAALDKDRNLADCLPALADADSAIGQLRPEVASILGLPAGVPVASGGGDNMMAAIGTGNVSTGRLTVSLGTSGTLFASTDQPVIDSAGEIAAFCSSTGGWMPLLCTMNCTVSTELTRGLFSLPLYELEPAVAAVAPGANGVMTLPFFNGERSPNLPAGKGCLFGLDEGNYTQANLLRSAMESAVYGLRAGLDGFRAQGCAVDTIRLTGGGAGSGIWRQMVADIFALPVTVQAVDEGAALGAALQAFWMYENQQGGTQALQTLVDSHLTLDDSRACAPQADAQAAYAELYQHYLRHVAAVVPLYT